MSNLLEKASVLLTPTAYEDGGVLSIKPSDGTGDFSFSRGSAGTRVNELGLIESMTTLSDELVQNGDFEQIGSELVTNGSFDTDSDWSKLNANISDGKGNLDGDGQTSLLWQDILTNGKTYKATFTISDYNELGEARVMNNDGAAIYTITSNGTFTIYFKHTISNGNFLFRARTGAIFSIDNVSVKEVGQNWTFGGDNFSIVDGALRINRVTNTTFIQQNVLTSGKKYKVEFDVLDKDDNNGTFIVRLGSNNVYDVVTYEGTRFSKILTSSGTDFRIYSSSDNGVIYVDNISVIEITDDTDLPRINYTNFDYEDVLGDELVNYDNFTYGSGGWSLVGSKWVFDDATSGYLVIDNFDVEVGQKYQVTVNISISSGDANFRITSGNGQTLLFNYTDFADGETTFETTVTGVDGTIQRLFAPTSLTDNSFTLNSISIKRLTEDVVVPYSGEGSLLLEPQSTNKLTYSEDFSEYSSVSVTLESGYLAPDGSNNAYKVSGTIGTSSLYLGGVSGTDTRTIWARTVSGTGTTNLCSYGQNTNNNFTITEQWQRFEVNGTTTTTGETNFYAVDFRFNTANPLSEVIIWGAQAEALSYATSYIPTNGSTVTRLADVCNNSGNSDLINSTEGVLYAEISALANYNTQRWLSLSDGTHSNAVKIGLLNSATDFRFAVEVRSANSTQAFMTYNFGAITPTMTKVAIKFKQNDFALWVNGTERATDTNGNAPTGLNELAFDRGDGGQDFEGNVKCVAVFKETLSDTELQKLTTI